MKHLIIVIFAIIAMFASCSLMPKSEEKESDKVEVYRSPISGKEIRMEDYKISKSEQTNHLYELFVKDKVPIQRKEESYYDYNVRKASHFIDINNMLPDESSHLHVSRNKIGFIATLYNNEIRGDFKRTRSILAGIGITAVIASFFAIGQIIRVQQRIKSCSFYTQAEKTRELAMVMIPAILITFGVLFSIHYMHSFRVPDAPLYQLILYEVYGGG